MENVPKIVRERLKVAVPSVSHPDADALTAFAEQSLPEIERDSVLIHLSRCAECREVVALALPVEEPMLAATSSSPTRRLGWPTLRWGFAAAGLIVIVSLGVLQSQRHSESMTAFKARQATVTEAKNELLPTVASPEPAKARDKFQTTDKENSVSAGASRKDKLIADLKTSPQPEPATAAPQVSAGNGRGYGEGAPAHGPRMLNQIQQNANALQAPAAPPSQYANQASAVGANAPAPSAPQSTVSVEAQSQAVQQSASLDASSARASAQPVYDYANAKVEKTKPVETAVTTGGPQAGASAFAPISGHATPPSTALIAAWRITPDGVLQRSLDQGGTWHDVDVRANGSAASGNFSVATQTELARTKKAVPSATTASAPPVFRAFAANGADVWAGASGAVLYHSTDAGSHWARVVPSTGAAVLGGDILSLNFPDSQHGTVSTSTSQLWTTSDGGQTWQQQ